MEQVGITNVIAIVIAAMSCLGSIVISAAALGFTVYRHFSTLRTPKISYVLTELADYGLPNAILASLDTIPSVLEIRSTGNTRAEHVNAEISTASDIREVQVEAVDTHSQTREARKTQLSFESLNPGETAKITIKCAYAAGLKSYVTDVRITHSEGLGEKAL